MCPSPGSRFRPWSARRLPTSCLVQNDSRVPISVACSNALVRFGNKAQQRASSGTASRRGDTGGSPTFRNGAVPVKLHFSIADRRDTIIRSRSLGACGRLYPPGVVRSGCQLHAWSKTIPECQSQSRARTRWYGSATRPTTCIIGNRVPARGHRWIAHLQARLFPPC